GRTEERVLRLYFGESGEWKAGLEGAALRLLRQAGYPVPAVIAVERGAAALGRPFLIMERVPGELLWGPMLEPGAPQADRHMRHFCRLMVQLHTLAWQRLPAADVARLPRRTVAEQLQF